MSGTISHSSLSAASSPASAYVIPPHSASGAWAGSRPWISSHTNVPITPTRRRFIGAPAGAWPSDRPQHLLLERRDRADDTGRHRERAEHDAARIHRWLERA